MPFCFIHVKYAVSDTFVKPSLKTAAKGKVVNMLKSCSEHGRVALTNISITSEKILNAPMPVSSKTELLFSL